MLGQISQLVFLCGEAGLRPFKQNVGDGRSVIRKVTLKRSVRELRILNRHHEPLCFLGTGCGDGKRPCVPWKRRSEEHTSELQSRLHLVCRLLLEKKKSTGCSLVRVSAHSRTTPAPAPPPSPAHPPPGPSARAADSLSPPSTRHSPLPPRLRHALY